MQEATRKILAYQQGPLILLCRDAGTIPSQFLESLSLDERTYLTLRCESQLMGVMEDVLPLLSAAGVAPSVSPLLVDALCDPVAVHEKIDSLFLPLAADPSTKQWLSSEIGGSFRQELRELVRKTRQRFGGAQLVVLSVLPRFIDGSLVSDDLVCVGESVLDGAVESPLYASALLDPSFLGSLCDHWSWIGVNAKFFSSDSLREELISRLSSLRVVLVAS